MKVVTKYVSILGREFDDPRDAMADEDRLPSIIATYEKDLARMIPGGQYAGKHLTEDADLADTRRMYQEAIGTYKRQWAEVQAERANSKPKEEA